MAELLQFPPPILPAAPPSGPEDTLNLPDTEARRAALDIRSSWIVEAPAGSGKTGLLIQRLLKLLAFSDVQRPSEVLAITFTRKAAAELRNRVLEQLADARIAKPLKPDAGDYERITRDFAEHVLRKDQALGWHLLDTPQGLNIRTIDSFCSELAASLPLLSGGMGARQAVDDARPLYEKAAERALRELGGPDVPLDRALRCILLHRDGQIGDTLHLIAGMLGDREQWGELVPLDTETLDEETLDGPVRSQLEATLERVICQGLTQAAGRIPADLFAELARFAARLSTAPGSSGAPSPIGLCARSPQPPGSAAIDHEHWLALIGLLLTKEGSWRGGKNFPKNSIGFEMPKSDKPWLEDLIAQMQAEDERRPGLRDALCAIRCLPPARYPDDQWRVAKALFHVLRRALAELGVLFAERGVCDFTEIALAARRLLQSDPDLLATPSAQLAHLLVDEMQDTSAGQYELLQLLTRSWDGGTQTIFLVGDPKQSIYLFRQARVARFLRTQASGQLGEVPLRALRLTANFRSQAALVDQFNEVFGQILPPPEEIVPGSFESVEVPFVAAVAARAPGHRAALRWHARLAADAEPDPAGQADPGEESADPTAGDEALVLRSTIEDFRARWSAGRHAKPAKIAVLARGRAHLAPVIAEFHRDRGEGPLPFHAVEIELLNERPEVLDLLAVTRALLHPGDRVAWLAVLRSPVCGLALPDLLLLTGEGSEADPDATVGHLVTYRGHLLSPEGQTLLARAWPVLAEAQVSLGRTAFSTQVERTWRSLGADAPLRADQRTNTRRFLDLLRKLEAGPEPLSLLLLNRGLGQLYAEPFAAPEAVELMTIHKAKGLEWDLVLVPALERGAGNSRHELLKWLELDGANGGESEVILAPIQGKGEASSALSNWLAQLQTARETAEAKRLFYVACTRAREELHLFAACGLKKDGSLAKPRGNSLLGASWVAAEPVLRTQLASQRLPPAPFEVISSLQPSLLPVTPSGLQGLALAANAEDEEAQEYGPPKSPQLSRLPMNFQPLHRFRNDARRLPYPAAGLLRHEATFRRPEGSFAARSFGNVTHRFLDLAAQRLAAGGSADALLTELPDWHGRLTTAFRAEGLSPGLSGREAGRALGALVSTLRDPSGRWVLAPHSGARSERALQLGDPDTPDIPSRNLRADRIFFAGAEPLSQTGDSHLWIVDFKTAEAGGRPETLFFTEEKAKYQPQMEAYARACRAADRGRRPIVLALFYSLIPHLVYWPYEPFTASD